LVEEMKETLKGLSKKTFWQKPFQG